MCAQQQPDPQKSRSQRHLPGYQQTPKPQAEPEALAQLSHDAMQTAALHLMELDYGEDGLTRDQIRKRYRDLPEAVYLRMPSSRRYYNAAEALRDALDARSRSEGDFLGAQPDIPDAESVGDGGPPAWGGDPLLTVDAVEDGGSAEDTQGLNVAEGEETVAGDGHTTDLDR